MLHNKKVLSKCGIISGAVWNTLGSTMYGANSFIMLAVVGRYGSVEETGCFGIAFTTAQILYIVGLFGVNHFQQTDYTQKYSFKIYTRAKLFSSILMLLGCVLTITILRFENLKLYYTLLLTLLMVLNAVGELFQSMFFQHQRLDLSGGALFFRTLWSLVAFVFIVMIGLPILYALALQVLINLCVTVYYGRRYVPKFVNDKSYIDENDRKEFKTRKLIVECLPLFVSVFLMNLILNASKYGIELFMNDVEQGYYNMIFMPAQVINLTSQFIYKPALKQYSAVLSTGNIKVFRAMLWKHIGLIGGLTLGCSVMAFWLGIPVLDMIYNKELSQYKGSLVVIVLAGGILAMYQLYYYILVIMRMQCRIMVIYIIGLVVSVLLTITMIDGVGIKGAAVSFLISQVSILVGYIVCLRREIRRMVDSTKNEDRY